jgi:hypothetical protein
VQNIVHDDGNTLIISVVQNMVEERRLSSPKESGAILLAGQLNP